MRSHTVGDKKPFIDSDFIAWIKLISQLVIIPAAVAGFSLARDFDQKLTRLSEFRTSSERIDAETVKSVAALWLQIADLRVNIASIDDSELKDRLNALEHRLEEVENDQELLRNRVREWGR